VLRRAVEIVVIIVIVFVPVVGNASSTTVPRPDTSWTVCVG